MFFKLSGYRQCRTVVLIGGVETPYVSLCRQYKRLKLFLHWYKHIICLLYLVTQEHLGRFQVYTWYGTV